MKRTISTILIVLFCFFNGYAQEIETDKEERYKISFGLESEIMTYINKGYHGSFWIGMNGIRSRFVYAQATYPSSFAPDGFKDLKSEFYEMEIDFFLGKKRKEYRGLWYAVGAGLTKQSVKSKETGLKGKINLFDIHTGVGYSIGIYRGFYINPWVGLDLHVNRRDIAIGNERWKPRFIDFVGGAKLGYSF